MRGERTALEPWGGSWPQEGHAIDVPSAVAAGHWRTLRVTLERLGWWPDANLHPEHGLVGYTVPSRNAALSIGLVQRSHGVAVVVTAVLCRGMEHPRAALAAVDHGNRLLRLGQLLFYPGPPHELAFYATLPWQGVDPPMLAAWLQAVLREIEEGGHPAVARAGGVHPADLSVLWMLLADAASDPVALAAGTEAAAPSSPAGAAPPSPKRKRSRGADGPLAIAAPPKPPRRRRRGPPPTED